MSQSLSKLFVHLIFHIKSTSCLIKEETNQELYAYIGSILKDNNSLPIIINGVEDHVHILCVMSKNISLSKLTEELKRHSSRWIKKQEVYYQKFAWQGGYGAFSVSSSLHDKTVSYICKQREHHRTMTFQDEYRLFLKEYDIDYDEKYVWID